MLFSELLEKDKFGAFSDYILVSIAKQYGIIPEGYHNIIKDLCPCGSEKIIRNNCTEVRCCDPRCPIKLGHYLSNMLGTSGVKGIGEALCLRIMDMMFRYKNLNSHILFLLSPEADWPFSLTDHETDLVRSCVNSIREKRFTYAGLVQMVSIPEFNNSSHAIFKGINNSADLVSKLESEGGLSNFLGNRGVKDPMKHFYLSEFILDILQVEANFLQPLLPSTTNVLKVVSTGNQTFRGASVKTEAFIEMCNKLGFTPDGSFRFFAVEDSEAVSSVHYIISEPHNQSTKAQKARGRERAEGRKLLYTCDEFFEVLVQLRKDVLGIDIGGSSDD